MDFKFWFGWFLFIIGSVLFALFLGDILLRLLP